MGEEYVMVLSGVCNIVFGVLSIMHLQILVTKYSTSSYNLGQKKCYFISSKVLSNLKCTMSACNSLNTNGVILLGNFTWLFSLSFL